MDPFLSIDFESRSTVDLRKSGVYPYATDPTTDLWCMAYALNDEPVKVWTPGEPVPEEIRYALDEGYDFRAWNAAFERIMWHCIARDRYNFPTVPRPRWVCSAVEAAAMSLPRHLSAAAKALKIPEQKDDTGYRLMLQMAKPRRPRKTENPKDGPYWWGTPDRIARLKAYCQQDVEVERAIARRLRPILPRERDYYLLDQWANDKGVLIDTKLVRALKALAEEAVADANNKLIDITSGRVTAVTKVQDIRGWLAEQGLDLPDLTKQTVADLLALPMSMDSLEEAVREVLTIRQDAGKTSVAKLNSMLLCLCKDERARGLLQFSGANTGRWSGRLIQPQNFPRPTEKDVERHIPQVLEGDYAGLAALETPVMVTVSNLLRSCFIAAPGNRFMCADFKAIEGHVTAWLAGQEAGMMTYEEMAGAIFDMDPADVGEDSDERHVGKTAVLGCGFGMGWKKYGDTVKLWTGVVLEDDMSKAVVDTYRERNHLIVSLWRDLEDAALAAVKNPGVKFYAGRRDCITYVVRNQFLWCKLPSGRLLCYPQPRIEPYVWGRVGDVTSKHHIGRRPPGFKADSPPEDAVEVSITDPVTRQWGRRSLYGGLQTENIVQATARDLMAAAMLRVQNAGYPVVLTVHDEVLAEVPNDHGNLDEFMALMSERPAWASHIPVTVTGWEGRRYRK
jgi:DNA polymerase